MYPSTVRAAAVQRHERSLQLYEDEIEEENLQIRALEVELERQLEAVSNSTVSRANTSSQSSDNGGFCESLNPPSQAHDGPPNSHVNL